MLAVFDPVGIEMVNTNVTGTTMYAPQLVGERLRMLSVKLLSGLLPVSNEHSVIGCDARIYRGRKRIPIFLRGSPIAW